jgi:hypothetical protein
MSTDADKKTGKISGRVPFVQTTFKQPLQPVLPVEISPESLVSFRRATPPQKNLIRSKQRQTRRVGLDVHSVGDDFMVMFVGHDKRLSTYDIPSCRMAEFERELLALVRQFARAPEDSQPGVESQAPDFAAESKVYIPKQEAILSLIFNASEWYEAATICKLGGFSGTNPSAQPHKWKKAGKIFALRRGATDVYPSYAFGDDFRPIPAMKDVLDVFKDKKTDLKIAAWFASDNGWLRNKRPLDLISSDAESVIKAAEIEVIPIDHG